MKILYIAGAITGVVLFSYAGFSYYGQKQLAMQLNQVLDDTLKEKDQLQAAADQLQVQLKEKEDKLSGLSDVQGIKLALTNAQVNIENLNKELEKANRERMFLQEANVSLNARLQNTTKEFMRTMTDMKGAQDQLAKANKERNPDKNKIEELNKNISEKNQELAGRKEELDNLKASSQSLMATNKILEKKLKDLESSRNSMSQKVDSLQADIGAREPSSRQLQSTISSLRDELSQKEKQIAALEDKLNRQVSPVVGKFSLPVERSDPKLQNSLEQLRSANDKLKLQISGLSEELNNERARAARLANVQKSGGERKFEEVKADMERLSGILIKKEFEIESAKKDALAAKEELVNLQAKLSGLQDSLYTSRVNQEKLKELENQRLTMQSQLNQVQQDLLKKNELIESLQKNMDYMTIQVEMKVREKAGLDAKLSLLDVSSKGELEKEKQSNEEKSIMYNSLKSQISQFSDAISLKEAEIENKRKEISSLKEDLSGLRVRSASLENDLYETKENQKKIMGDLSAAVRLNSVLQERIRYLPAGSGSPYPDFSLEDKNKADELKRRIEVILEPDKQPR